MKKALFLIFFAISLYGNSTTSSILKETLLNIEKLKPVNLETGYQYHCPLEKCGMQTAFAYLYKTYEKVKSVAPHHPILISSKDENLNFISNLKKMGFILGDISLQVNLDYNFLNTANFTHYNPEFLKWFHKELNSTLQDREFVKESKKDVLKYFGKQIKTYNNLYIFLQHESELKEKLLKEYQFCLSQKVYARCHESYPRLQGKEFEFSDYAGGWHLLHNYSIVDTYEVNLYGSATYFWLRREIDGTDKLFKSILDLLTDAYIRN
jgi:hypothetical protein